MMEADDGGKPYEATPNATLEEQITNPCVPKNEREWWAHRRISDLEAQLAARDAEIAAMKRNVARHCTNYAPCYKMLAARPTNGDS